MRKSLGAVLLVATVIWACAGSPGLEGPPGAQGPSGDSGIDGQSVAVVADIVNCPGGGVAITSASGTSYVCNGTAAAGTPNDIPDTLVARSDAGNFAANTVTIDGDLQLKATSVVRLDGARFLRSSGTDSLYLGIDAGSGSSNPNGNTGVGHSALSSVTSGGFNTAMGSHALSSNALGSSNTAVGYHALTSMVSGNENTAVGVNALQANVAGTVNTAVGSAALIYNTTGYANTAVGQTSMFSMLDGGSNTAVGVGTLMVSQGGNNNTAIGVLALHGNTGSGNIGLGYYAGYSATTGSNDIYIGNDASANTTESNAIRIGNGATAGCYISGIDGFTSASGIAVLINTNGKLGTTTSSRRFKHDVRDLGADSDELMRLRPVAFKYNEDLDPEQLKQFGLIAEEVAEVDKDLVQYKDGKPNAVRYQFVNAMMLGELQKQRSESEKQRKTIAALMHRIEQLEKRQSR